MTVSEEPVAIFRLALMRKKFPALSRREVEAKNALALAIMTWDDAEERLGDPVLKRLEVNQACAAYGVALAKLLRGDED